MNTFEQFSSSYTKLKNKCFGIGEQGLMSSQNHEEPTPCTEVMHIIQFFESHKSGPEPTGVPIQASLLNSARLTSNKSVVRTKKPKQVPKQTTPAKRTQRGRKKAAPAIPGLDGPFITTVSTTTSEDTRGNDDSQPEDDEDDVDTLIRCIEDTIPMYNMVPTGFVAKEIEPGDMEPQQEDNDDSLVGVPLPLAQSGELTRRSERLRKKPNKS